MDNLSSEEIQQRAHQITDESLESTRRILGLAIEVLFLLFLVCFVVLSAFPPLS
ncbi:LOW QUALITY PROTEIN: SNAP23 isoform 5 [Pan troglodytes]|uniref:Synaptosome associated protein 23 n=4 Tax=Homininae TaxID=207598 RepID=H3BU94_HUMAN|nr:synaptosome associated protein 23 [Homo sapiens]KAI2573785.1 synaptosome associated protein 23 [Homo sapiens]KAI4057382.1 synaptosome associated protein 23 [Homo sapiens]KAI4057389.1 synaptosome associated protein 23 [Homo sapiens]PNI94540.1 LOW QUALITY PROTEIN: SNAP23 isoform 5 [Pan troglodytes]